MITTGKYISYFGVDTAPSQLTRLEFLSLEIIKSIMTKAIPTSTDALYDNFLNALMEQIKFLDENEDLMSVGGDGYALGKFSEGSSKEKETNQTNKRISPMTYAILLNAGLLYGGLC